MGSNYVGSNVQRSTAASTFHYKRSYAPAASTARRNTSRSEPDLAWPRSTVKRSTPAPQRILSCVGAPRPERIQNSSTQLQPANGTSQSKSSKELVSYRVVSGHTETIKSPSKTTVTDGAARDRADPG